MYPLANSTFRSDAEPPTAGCCKVGGCCKKTQRVTVAPASMNTIYEIERRPSVVAVPITPPPPAAPGVDEFERRPSSVVAVPIPPPPPAAPEVDETAELIEQEVEQRLDRQERDEWETMERNLAQMQQFRREFVMCVLRDDQGAVLANLNEMLQANQNSSIMRPFPGFDYPDNQTWFDDDDDAMTSFDNLTPSLYDMESEMSSYTTAPDMSSYMTAPDMSSYMTAPDMSSYTTAPDMSSYMTAADMSSYMTAADMSSYMTAPDISSYMTAVDMSSYMTAADMSSYMTAPDISSYMTAPDISSYMTAPDMSSSSRWADTTAGEDYEDDAEYLEFMMAPIRTSSREECPHSCE